MSESIAILCFGFAVILLEIVVLIRKQQGFGPQAVRIVGVTVIITVAAFLAISGAGKESLSQMIGLLGTIAGYLVGRSDSKPEG
jgi:hypothetical protein